MQRGLIAAFTALVLWALPVPAVALECPRAPQSEHKEWEVEVRAAVGKLGGDSGAELAARTRSLTSELVGRLPQADRGALEQTMVASYCAALRDNRSLSEEEREARIRIYVTAMRDTLRPTVAAARQRSEVRGETARAAEPSAEVVRQSAETQSAARMAKAQAPQAAKERAEREESIRQQSARTASVNNARAELAKPAAPAPTATPPASPSIVPDKPGKGAADPGFPWPPPQPSAARTVPPQRLWRALGVATASEASERRLEHVDRALTNALERAGYTERSYYSVPGGYALATRLERIDEQGQSAAGDARWIVGAVPGRSFSLSEYLAALFDASPGRFRIVVLVVSAQPFRATGAAPSAEAARAWVSAGFNTLPAEIAARPYLADVVTTALIYEFEKPPAGAAEFRSPGHISADQHLAGTRLLTTLPP